MQSDVYTHSLCQISNHHRRRWRSKEQDEPFEKREKTRWPLTSSERSLFEWKVKLSWATVKSESQKGQVESRSFLWGTHILTWTTDRFLPARQIASPLIRREKGLGKETFHFLQSVMFEKGEKVHKMDRVRVRDNAVLTPLASSPSPASEANFHLRSPLGQNDAVFQMSFCRGG